MSGSRNVQNYFDRPNAGSDNKLVVLGSLISNKIPQKVIVTVLAADINAGLTIIPAVLGKTITVTGVQQRANGGTAAGATAVVVQDTAASPVNVASTAVATLTSGTLVQENTSGVTLGAAFLAAATLSKGIAVGKTGSSLTTATSITFVVEYFIS